MKMKWKNILQFNDDLKQKKYLGHG